MRKIFCPGCGKDIPRSQEFCFDCKPRKELEFRDTNIKFCLSCDKINPLNNWGRFETFEEGISTALKRSVKSKGYEIIDMVIPEVERKPGLNLEAEVKVVYDDQEFIIPVGILVTTCAMCGTITEQFIAGTLQLRNCGDDVKAFVWAYVEKNKDKGVNINKDAPVVGGHDYIFNNKQHMKRLAHLMKKQFPYSEYKEAAQHFSEDRQTGKVIYRLNILFRQGEEEKEEKLDDRYDKINDSVF